MNLESLDGVYSLTIKTNAGGTYSVKPITGNICIENGKIRGADELNVVGVESLKFLKVDVLNIVSPSTQKKRRIS